ncbi:MAG: DUF805 domain-containing protein [Victivallaceae bacterium]|nr:DUF805 domain-containing protein [Victivallaceae bacterium]
MAKKDKTVEAAPESVEVVQEATETTEKVSFGDKAAKVGKDTLEVIKKFFIVIGGLLGEIDWKFIGTQLVEVFSTKQYCCFTGRVNRKQFWSFFVPIFIIMLILNGCGYFALINLLFVLPVLGMTARRLHDVGVSGWIQILYLLPWFGSRIPFVLGLYPVLYLCALESDSQNNNYGDAQ